MREIPLRSTIGLATLALLLAGAPASAVTHQVLVLAGGFDPPSLVIAVGDTVHWNNLSGAAHNVVADDGSFTNGPPSATEWVFTHTFTAEALVPYHSAGTPAFTGHITVTQLFADGYEGGTTSGWDATFPEAFASCNCYFSGDCPTSAGFCNWGVLQAEDNCEWMENKPGGIPGNGCDVLFPPGGWQLGICDGVCEPATLGSLIGSEDRNIVIQAVQLWSRAILEPARQPGGGPVDPGYAHRAQVLPYVTPDAAILIGRQVADLLILAGAPRFYEHFCHYEGYPGPPNPAIWVDLSQQPCKVTAGQLLTEALVAEMVEPESGGAILARLPELCGGWEEIGRGQRCAEGFSCVRDRVRHMAIWLTTPRAGAGALQRALAHPAR